VKNGGLSLLASKYKPMGLRRHTSTIQKVTDFRTGISLRCVEEDENGGGGGDDNDNDDNLCIILPRNILCQTFESLQIVYGPNTLVKVKERYLLNHEGNNMCVSSL
jgi:hypothetical protein